ncbi:zf-HC2 domain-containing protein [Aureliella helgolandensis]|uniref:Putative zinc-finger domain-containing protein n=1 Tax=Aureliella helgolandensis TaxID=2527968 RepID=A0A518G6M4_9BACT|nr:zf-HC2 domain-containing protein [Aureliella helgolandensis]QDV24247.1 hypothetical protein Q31a_25620 [Aureliella helgolandensis]
MASDSGSNAKPTENILTDDWQACAPGTLTAYRHAAKLASLQTKRRRAMSVGVGACVVLALVSLSALYRPDGSGAETKLPGYGGLTCSTVIEKMHKFVSGELEENDRAKVVTHLVACPHCLKLYQADANRKGVDLGIARHSINRQQTSEHLPLERRLHTPSLDAPELLAAK